MSRKPLNKRTPNRECASRSSATRPPSAANQPAIRRPHAVVANCGRQWRRDARKVLDQLRDEIVEGLEHQGFNVRES
jgi:hypothetical protein